MVIILFILPDFYFQNEEIGKIPQIKLYNDLVDGVSDEININDYLEHCNQCKSSHLIKTFVHKIVNNYENYKRYLEEESYVTYCRYFIYWLYREKNFYISSSGSLDTWNNCIGCVWAMLENARTLSDKKCKFENDIDSFAIVQIKKILDDMCLIKKKKNLIPNMSERDICSNLNKIKHYYLHLILIQMSSIPDNTVWKKKHFNFGNDCSIQQAYAFLQEKQCPSEVKERCPEAKVYDTRSPELQQHCSLKSCNNLTELCQKVFPPQECPVQSEITKSESLTLTCKNLEELCPKYCDEHRNDPVPTSEERPEYPAKFPYLQLPVTVLSSVVGTIFFFLFLYKVKEFSF
ncbi:hypothetical protein PVBG_06283 [Plasmodium vivax Brazil I]|uniref:PIR Superfamily Protein n=1 Tax=Plasmodium vivax (strain Brazil I) TaxID=1033975 RepID=A0A0J9VQ13_PLAV1|nr:hypothetical protein PVBG_06283 [Plasmodium vivax Brazil I]